MLTDIKLNNIDYNAVGITCPVPLEVYAALSENCILHIYPQSAGVVAGTSGTKGRRNILYSCPPVFVGNLRRL